MKRIPSTITLTVVSLVTFLAAAGTSVADEQMRLNARLHGDYAFTETDTCFIASGFDPTTFAVVPASGGGAPFMRVNQFGVSGIYRFNGDGTGTGTIRFLVIFASPPGTAISETEGTCDLNYAVAPGGSVVLDRACTTNTTAGAGLGGINVGNIRESLQLTQGDRLALVGPTATPVVETITNNGITSLPRICARNGIVSKISSR